MLLFVVCCLGFVARCRLLFVCLLLVFVGSSGCCVLCYEVCWSLLLCCLMFVVCGCL